MLAHSRTRSTVVQDCLHGLKRSPRRLHSRQVKAKAVRLFALHVQSSVLSRHSYMREIREAYCQNC